MTTEKNRKAYPETLALALSFVPAFVRSYLNKFRCYVHLRTDVEQVARISAWRATLSYDPIKGKNASLKTFIWRAMEFGVKRWVCEHSGPVRGKDSNGIYRMAIAVGVSFATDTPGHGHHGSQTLPTNGGTDFSDSNPLTPKHNPWPEIEDKLDAAALYQSAKDWPRNERICLRLASGVSEADVAREIGVSRERIRQIKNRFMPLIEKWMERQRDLNRIAMMGVA